jgi:adenosylhomocysteine nucleosidase
MNDGPLLLQVAMDVETDAYEADLDAPERVDIGGYRCALGRVDGVPVAVLRTRIGAINAAASTALAVERLKPRLVLNQGLAGGHDRALHRGDIVIGEKVVPIAAYQSPARGPGEGVDPRAWAMGPFDDEDERTEACLRADPALVAMLTVASARALPGVIGSGDAWNREADFIDHLHNAYGTSCEEMEAFAAGCVCRNRGIPFLAVRILSNHELHGEAYERSCGGALQAFIRARIKRLYAYVTEAQ